MQRKGLYRSRRDRILGGVAGGIAQSLNADPAIIRLIFAVLVIVGGGGLLLYLILWIAIPEEPFEYYQAAFNPENSPGSQPAEGGETAAPSPVVYPARRNNGGLIVGLVLICLGALFLLDRFLPTIHLHFRDFWPIIIVVAGITLIVSSFAGRKKS